MPLSTITIRLTPLILMVQLLYGCGALPDRNSTYSVQDSAPEHNIDIASIPNAQPRIVPYSRYGNPASYVVYGKRYDVMSNSNRFEQQGTASWYGTKFHGRKTSSGEPYDMFAMTAAHKSLPLPTWIEVTNLSNQLRIIVKVNDRGPFVDDRILDLSYAAASKLGVIETGTAPVSIRAINPTQYLAAKNRTKAAAPPPIAKTSGLPPRPITTLISPPPAKLNIATPQPRQRTTDTNDTPSVVSSTTSNFTVPSVTPSTQQVPTPPINGFFLQVAAFSDRQNAEQLGMKLSALNSSGTIQINPDHQLGNDLYRVRIGPLTSLSEAGKVAAQIALMGLGEPKIMLD